MKRLIDDKEATVARLHELYDGNAYGEERFGQCNDFKLYVWDSFYSGYYSGMAVAIASSLEEAKALVGKDTYGPYNLENWGDYYTVPLNSLFAVSLMGGG